MKVNEHCHKLDAINLN